VEEVEMVNNKDGEENKGKDLETRLQHFINRLSTYKGVPVPKVIIVPSKYWFWFAPESFLRCKVIGAYSNYTKTIYLNDDMYLSELREYVLHEFAHHFQFCKNGKIIRKLNEYAEYAVKRKKKRVRFWIFRMLHELQAQGWTSKMLKDKQIRREFDEKVAFDL
jgi:hypothetical protein